MSMQVTMQASAAPAQQPNVVRSASRGTGFLDLLLQLVAAPSTGSGADFNLANAMAVEEGATGAAAEGESAEKGPQGWREMWVALVHGQAIPTWYDPLPATVEAGGGAPGAAGSRAADSFVEPALAFGQGLALEGEPSGPSAADAGTAAGITPVPIAAPPAESAVAAARDAVTRQGEAPSMIRLTGFEAAGLQPKASPQPEGATASNTAATSSEIRAGARPAQARPETEPAIAEEESRKPESVDEAAGVARAEPGAAGVAARGGERSGGRGAGDEAGRGSGREAGLEEHQATLPPAAAVRAAERAVVGEANDGAAPAGPARQVAEHIARLELRGGERRELELQLQPEHLGRVRLHLALEDGVLQARIIAGTGESRDLLRQDLQQLRQSLLEQGFRQVSVQVSLGAPGEQSAGDERRAWWGRQGDRNGLRVGPVAAGPVAAAISAYRGGGGRLDLRM